MDALSAHLVRAIGDARSVLDVGCGANSPLGRLLHRPEQLVGVDVYAGAIETSRARGLHDEYVLADALELDQHFTADSFDAVVALDLLEHLDRHDGRRLLEVMATIARQRVIVLTPNGFLPQAPTDGNPFQAHRSGWTAREFRALGYDVTGLHGWRVLRGERGRPRWRPARVWGRIAHVTEPVTERLPGLAFHLLAVKRLS